MKSHKKSLIVVVCIIQAAVIFCLGYSIGKAVEKSAKDNSKIADEIAIDNSKIADEIAIDEMGSAIRVSGMLAPYKYIAREIDLAYFYHLNDTSTYEQIVKEIGEPNGQYGSGIIYDYYEIYDGLYVSILFLSEDNKVTLMRLCTQEETLDIIYPPMITE